MPWGDKAGCHTEALGISPPQKIVHYSVILFDSFFQGRCGFEESKAGVVGGKCTVCTKTFHHSPFPPNMKPCHAIPFRNHGQQFSNKCDIIIKLCPYIEFLYGLVSLQW